MSTQTKKKTYDPDVLREKSTLGNLTKAGAPADVIEAARRRLDEATRLAAIKRAIAAAPELTPEVQAGIIADIRAAGAR